MNRITYSDSTMYHEALTLKAQAWLGSTYTPLSHVADKLATYHGDETRWTYDHNCNTCGEAWKSAFDMTGDDCPHCGTERAVAG